MFLEMALVWMRSQGKVKHHVDLDCLTAVFDFEGSYTLCPLLDTPVSSELRFPSTYNCVGTGNADTPPHPQIRLGFFYQNELLSKTIRSYRSGVKVKIQCDARRANLEGVHQYVRVIEQYLDTP
jgi:hypothetical protein